MEKPLTLLAVDFENDLIDLINNSGLPAFIIKPMFEKMLVSIKQAERKQLEVDRESYNKSLEVEVKGVDNND